MNRYRIAAYSTATGALITTFTPVLNGGVRAIVATNTTVYVGGAFTTANGNNAFEARRVQRDRWLLAQLGAVRQ